MRAGIVDVDGTLVDTNYHHALAWYRAFRAYDLTIPVRTLHRHVGMGGDKFVSGVAGNEVEERLGEELRGRWEEIFDELIPEISPLPGARDLLASLRDRELRVVLASSSIGRHLNAFLDLVDARELTDGWTTKDDIAESKPEPDLVEAALKKAGTREAFMIGDTPWDVEAARKAGLPTVCVLTGGFSASELAEAGAAAVYESPRALAEDLAELVKKLDGRTGAGEDRAAGRR
jgi:HAD superfamily hydrolase (TIGR01549 family)